MSDETPVENSSLETVIAPAETTTVTPEPITTSEAVMRSDETASELKASETIEKPLESQETLSVTTEPTQEAETAHPESQSGQLAPVDPIGQTTEVPVQGHSPQAAQVQTPSASSPSLIQTIRNFRDQAAAVLQINKRKKLNRILSEVATQSTITNDQVEKLLHISDSTATRYLMQLVKEGKLKQGNKKGSGVTYTKT